MMNLKFIIAIILVALCMNGLKAENSAEVKKEDKLICGFLEEVPQFPGGYEALMNFIKANKKYPPEKLEQGVQGRVIVQFVVTKTGKISEAKVVRSVDPELDNEALRVISLLPDFIPGKMSGKPVNSWFILPVDFKIPETGEKK